MNGEQFEEVSPLLQVRGYHHPCRGSHYEKIVARIGLATSGMTRLIWQINNSSTSTKITLCKGPVLAIVIRLEYECTHRASGVD